MILDIIMILIVALLVLIGIRRGLARSLYGLLSIVLSGFLASVTGRWLAGLIYKNWLSPSIEKSVSEAFASNTSSVSSASDKVFSDLPSFVTDFLGMFGLNPNSVSTSVRDASASTASQVSDSINSVISPVAVPVISALLIIVLFLIYFLLFKLLSRLFLGVFELPVIHAVNAVFGGILGLAEGIALCFIIILVLRIVLQFSDYTFISEEMIQQSFFFKAVYNSSIISYISEIINVGTNLSQNAAAAVSAATEPVT